jgi:phage portal protein BeeE
MALGGDPDLSQPYTQHPWVYACITAISRAASSVPARIQKRLPDGEYETETATPLSKVLEFPNPLQSQRKFFRSIATAQMLYGETFLILLKKAPDGKMVPVDAVGGSEGMGAMIEPPEEVWPVRGDLVDAIIDEQTKLPLGWRFQTGGGYVTYPAHAVVQIAEVNPANPLRGVGPMQAAYRTAAKDFVIDRYDEALLQNGGSPGGVLTVDGPLSDADQRAIRVAWNEAHGRPEAHRKTAVLPQGTSYQEIGMSPQAMEHEKLREWDRQTILSIFGVPPVILGLETINYATAREQNRIFWDTTILPYLDFLKDEIQYKLVRRLYGPDSELILDFDISAVSALREDADSKVDRTLKLYEKGHRSFLEAATLAGWSIDEVAIEGGDDRYVPMNLAPAELIGVDIEDDEDEPTGGDEYYARESVLDGCCDDDGAVWTPDAALTLDAMDSSWPPHLSTEEKRLSYWKLYTAEEDKTIEKVAKRTKAVYRSLLLSVRKRVREIANSSSARGVDGVVTKFNATDAELQRLLKINVEKWGEELAAKIEPLLRASMVSAAGGVAVEMGTTPLITSTTDPFIIDFYKQYIPYLAELPNETLAKDIRRTMLKVLSDADLPTATTLPQAIRETLAKQEKGLTHLLGGLDTRADRIARTEVVKANNGARVQEMALNKVERHVWLTSRDASVRKEHQIMDGNETIVGEPFSNGLRYPGDQAASAREVANCRCVTNAITPPPETP